MKTFNFSNLQNATVQISGNPIAIFSQQPLIVSLPSPYKTRVTITSAKTNRSISETRLAVARSDKYVASYEISRMCQLVCDVEETFHRVAYDGSDVALSDFLTLKVDYEVSQSWTSGVFEHLEAFFASYDWHDKRNAEMETRRVFVNYPQTFNFDFDGNTDAKFVVSGREISIPMTDVTSELNHEVNVPLLFFANGGNVAQMRDNKIATFPRIANFANGQSWTTSAYQNKRYRLIVDESINDANKVYLRWLRRDGSIGYYLFQKSKETIASQSAQTYTRHFNDYVAGYRESVYPNEERQMFRRVESWNIGASALCDDEYAYLIDIATSPIIEMLEFAESDIDSAIWTRVNISASSFAREIPKSALQRLHKFECVLTMPKRNTITL